MSRTYHHNRQPKDPMTRQPYDRQAFKREAEAITHEELRAGAREGASIRARRTEER